MPSPHRAELIERLLAATPLRDLETPIDVACSGGPDSSALAVLAVASGRPVTLHHVDHGLRPSSGSDAACVKELADRLGATFVGHVVEIEPGPNLEARARAGRRAVLPEGAATGHTLDDQAETVLINLLRGTGVDGLAGMSPGAEHPLLGLRRAETHELCTLLGIETVLDETNAEQVFLRNKVRHRLLPLLAELSDRDPVPLLARTADLARADAAFLQDAAASAVTDDQDVVALRQVPWPLAARALRRWLSEERRTDGVAYPPSEAELARVKAIVDGSVRATELAGGFRVARTAGRLRLERSDSGTLRQVTAPLRSENPPAWAAHDLGPVVVSKAALEARIAEMGKAISNDYAESAPLLVGVLKGAMHFISDLSQAIELAVDVDFMAISSYGSATKTSGIVRIVKDLDIDLSGRHVLVVEDIIDSGLTLNYLRKYLGARGAASIEVCALLVKEGTMRVEQDLRYVGFEIPPTFVVGYGLDVAERYRNLDSIYTYIGEGSA